MQYSMSWAAYVGRFHPVAVHFPIALLLAAALADVLGRIKGYAHLAHAAHFCSKIGALGALFAAPLGWLAAATAPVPYEPAWLLSAHRWSGIATTITACLAAGCACMQERRASTKTARLFRVSLYAAAIAAAAAGHWGGMLTYGEHYFTWDYSR